LGRNGRLRWLAGGLPRGIRSAPVHRQARAGRVVPADGRTV